MLVWVLRSSKRASVNITSDKAFVWARSPIILIAGTAYRNHNSNNQLDINKTARKKMLPQEPGRSYSRRSESGSFRTLAAAKVVCACISHTYKIFSM